MLTDAASPGPWIFSTCMSLIAAVTILESFSVPISTTEKKQLLQFCHVLRCIPLSGTCTKHARFPASASMFGAIISCQQHKYYTKLNMDKCQDLNPKPEHARFPDFYFEGVSYVAICPFFLIKKFPIN